MKITKKYLDTLSSDHILVCKTPVVLPFSFISHMFILTKQGDQINRYEVFGVDRAYTQEHGCVFKNDLRPWQGMLYIFTGDIRRDGRRFGASLIKKYDAEDTPNIKAIISQIDKGKDYNQD